LKKKERKKEKERKKNKNCSKLVVSGVFFELIVGT
jgi:hypothetical protein